MSSRRDKRSPEPERVLTRLDAARLDSATVDESEGGFVFSAIAQAFDRVNDKLMLFRRGSALKTIAEGVPSGRVKIHDGHLDWRGGDSDQIAGRVLSAEEKADGVHYRGFLSGGEVELARKMREGIIDENSIELYVLRERPIEVPIGDVPVQARRWVDLAPSGNAVVREILEWVWSAVALVSSSSQGFRAVLETPRLVPYQDLPLASRSAAFDAEAARHRIEQWAGRGEERFARMSRAFLARGGYDATGRAPQFVGLIGDVVEGELVVVPEALDAAYRQLEERFRTDSPEVLAAAARTIGRYEERIRLTEAGAEPHNTDTKPATSQPETENDRPVEGDEAGSAKEPAETAGPTPSPTVTGSDEAATSTEADRLCKLRTAQLALAALETGA